MKNIFTLLGLFIFILCSAQPGTPDPNGVITAGPPDWVSGTQTGQGELALQFTYLNAAILLNDADIAAITVRQDTDSARIDIALTQLLDSLGYFFPESYGAGGADDSAAIMNMFAAVEANGGGVISFNPKSTYTFTGRVSYNFTTGVNVQILGNGATLDFTAVSVTGENAAFILSSTSTDNSAMSAVATMDEGDTVITVIDNLSLSAGDIVKVQSTDLFNPARAYYYQGELIQIQNVVDDTILVLSKELYDTYTPANVTLYKYAYPSLSIENLEVETDNNGTVIDIQNMKDIKVERCKFHGGRYAGLIVRECFGGTVDDNKAWDAWYSGTGSSYNIAVWSSQDVTVSNNKLYEARHNITISGITIPSRDVHITSNYCYIDKRDLSSSAIDSHGNVEFLTITENKASGISCAAKNAIISNNIIEANAVTDFQVLLQIWVEIDADYYIVSNNTVNDFNYETIESIGITFDFAEANVDIESIVVEGNTVKVGSPALQIQAVGSGDTGGTITHLKVANNILYSDANYALRLKDTPPAGVAINDFYSSGNSYIADEWQTFISESYMDVEYFTSNGDKYLCGSTSDIMRVQDSSFVNLRFMMPEFRGTGGGAASSVEISYDGVLEMYYPIFDNMDNANALDIDDGDLYIEVGRQDINANAGVGNTDNITTQIDDPKFGADAQANDDYEVDIPIITALRVGLIVTFTATTANTDGATLEITGVGLIDAILKMNDQALATGDIEAGQVVVCVWDGTNWQMTSQLAQ